MLLLPLCSSRKLRLLRWGRENFCGAISRLSKSRNASTSLSHCRKATLARSSEQSSRTPRGNVFEWSTEPWIKLARKVDRTIVPGRHKSCITTHAEVLARLLSAATAKKGDA
jgi:hypothetical protein